MANDNHLSPRSMVQWNYANQRAAPQRDAFYEFVIEEMDKVRKVIEENRKRKLTKHKKISHYTIIEINHCSPLEILKLQKNLTRIAQAEDTGIQREHRKVLQHDIRRLWG